MSTDVSRETTLRSEVYHTDPAKLSDPQPSKFKVRCMVRNDDPMDVSSAGFCPTSDLAKVQQIVCTAIAEAWATLYQFLSPICQDFIQWQVSTWTLLKNLASV
ncbi:uncharacterized protein LOC106065388 [Biomphalaria glabrata]|uniref:Uncharacterized protein LOC106065388 n=1 Tax=Biomphalaria glabrata TaxID=6526 RepID=A0A9W2ZP56_BIOGL|nr:uncharacterized protein LOC106065388 [Biomphalaria glabrata]